MNPIGVFWLVKEITMKKISEGSVIITGPKTKSSIVKVRNLLGLKKQSMIYVQNPYRS